MEPVKIYYSCTDVPKDKEMRLELNTHFMSLKRLSKITLCLTGDILPGVDWRHEQNMRLQSADLILLLVSPNFLASDRHYQGEMPQALERHYAKNATVVPILLRPTT